MMVPNNGHSCTQDDDVMIMMMFLYHYAVTIYVSDVCVCVLVCSSGAINSADWPTLSSRERRFNHSSVNSNAECQSTTAFALWLKNLPNQRFAGNILVS